MSGNQEFGELGDGIEVLAHAKLPDDLVLSEFESIIDALEALLLAPLGYEPFGDPGYSYGSRRRPFRDPEQELGIEVRRVQYGSDFLLVVGAIGTVAGTAYVIAQIIDKIQDIRLKNEDIARKKYERLQRERADQEALQSTARQATAEVIGNDLPWPEPYRPGENRWFFNALATLARFGVRIEIRPLGRGEPPRG